MNAANVREHAKLRGFLKRRRVEARLPRPPLPHVHLRRFRREARRPRPGACVGRRPGRPRRVPRSERLLGPACRALGEAESRSRQSMIGRMVDDAMEAIERDNPRLMGVLPKDHAQPALDKERLGRLIDLVSTAMSATRRAVRRMSSAGSTSTSSRSSPPPKGRGRRVLQPALRRPPPGETGAVSRARLRPMLRLRRHVRAAGGVRSSARERQRERWKGEGRPSRSSARSPTARPGVWRR